MNSITSEKLEQRLKELLIPSQLQVIDESAAHAGHAVSYTHLTLPTT